jgi:hypothetical protein
MPICRLSEKLISEKNMFFLDYLHFLPVGFNDDCMLGSLL